MSVLLGPLSGALVAGGIYYGFSNLMQTRTQQHIKDLHTLSVRLVETPNVILAPPSAAARVKPHNFTTELKARWNNEVECLFRGIQNLDRSAVEWGRTLLYSSSGKEDKGAGEAPATKVPTASAETASS
ncbi:hypothetical protein JR316_0013026 [Psilocybe cubensis]|uniref:Uncharacterized protein n=2 Tax=Psilocybe cubensis TaxID=181762 RepID=A0ACB8GG15_PSICU|nr:hypothetical protein JR316_0013026 [Psilocybe cubensis]KAH9474564.1 hypothetical protein JR316_0013026 [Psilocybe cubensis]